MFSPEALKAALLGAKKVIGPSPLKNRKLSSKPGDVTTFASVSNRVLNLGVELTFSTSEGRVAVGAAEGKNRFKVGLLVGVEVGAADVKEVSVGASVVGATDGLTMVEA